MKTHTPGPWWIENEKDNEGPWEISDCYGRTAEVYGEGEEGAANARLIAAAPELLDALKMAFEDWATLVGDDLDNDDVASIWKNCCRAINKAEGKVAE